MKASITIKDIAEALKVSHSTVSRALSPGKGRRRMSVATQQRVLEAADRMGYRPNALARHLVNRRSRSIGVIVRHFNDPFFSDMIQAIHVRLATRDYLGMFFSAYDAAEFEHAVTSLENRRAEGIISVSPSAEEYDHIRRAKTPVVFYGINGARDHWVGPDHFVGAGLAVHHLHRLGHRKIGFIGRNDPQNRRFQGFQETIRQLGLSARTAWIRNPNGAKTIRSVDGMLQNGYAQMQRLLALADRPTAVLCHNDMIAIGAERAVLEQGLRIPADMALIGFDALRESAYAAVPLTSVDPHLERMVTRLTETMIACIEKPDSCRLPIQHRMVPELVVRGSTGAPASAAAIKIDGGLRVHR